MQDRMPECDVALAEMLMTQRVERHAGLGPHSEVECDDVEVTSLAGERIDQCIGRGIGGLPRRGERRRGRPDQDQQRHAATRERIDEGRRSACLRTDDGLDVEAMLQ